MRKIIIVMAVAAIASGPLPPVAAEDLEGAVSFHKETRSAGIHSAYQGEWEYMVGGGASSFDCNADGFPDLFLAGGAAAAKFYRNISKPGGPIRFVAETSGLEFDKATGAYPIDIDSDGETDLVVLRVGENQVMRGLGGCKFEPANAAWGFDGGDAWSTALAATWEKGATWPTIAVGNYVDRFEEVSPWGSCTDNWLHRPRPEGDGFAAPLPLKPSFCPLSMLFTDWNRSGTPSLRVSNDREYYEGGREQMWHVDPGQAPALYGEAEGWRNLRIWGMGIASYDLNFDGYPEYFLTSMADNKLQALAEVPAGGKPRADYKDVAFSKGVTAHRPYTGGDLRPSTAWHTQFDDVNNDGLADLFIVKGNVAKMPDFAGQDPNNLLLQRPDGTFTEAGHAAGVASMAVGRGGGLTDFNLDGRLDMVVANRWENAELWRNTSKHTGNWIAVRLAQPAPNRDGIGAWLEVTAGDRVLRREITVGGGHVSGHLGWIHMGLGAAQQTSIRVIWPDGTASASYPVEANHFFIVDRAADAATIWEPR